MFLLPATRQSVHVKLHGVGVWPCQGPRQCFCPLPTVYHVFSAGDLAGHGLGTAHQLGGPLGTALSMGAMPPVQRSDDFLKETFQEVSWAVGLGYHLRV